MKLLTKSFAPVGVALALSLSCQAAGAAPIGQWDGVWAGMLNKTEPVSVTVAGGKVVNYTIRGFTPIAIEWSTVQGNRVVLRIGPDYFVRLVRTGQRAAYGVASGPLGNGTASLLRE